MQIAGTVFVLFTTVAFLLSSSYIFACLCIVSVIFHSMVCALVSFCLAILSPVCDVEVFK